MTQTNESPKLSLRSCSLAALLGLLWASACGPVEQDLVPPEIQTNASSIVNGAPAPDSDWKSGLASYLSLKDVKNPGFVSNCTGVVLPDRWVLTARHCFADKSGAFTVKSFRIKPMTGDQDVDQWDIVLHPKLDLALVHPRFNTQDIPLVSERPYYQPSPAL